MSLYIKKDPKADLQSTHSIYLKLGTITSLLIFIVLFRINLSAENEFEVTVIEQDVVTVEDIVMTRQDELPPPPPRPSVPVEVTNDAVIEDEFLDFSAEIDFDAMAFVATAPPPSADKEEEEEEIFIVVERMPELVGGLEALQRNIVYPEIARLAGIEGRVTVQFVIDERGNVNNPVVVRGIGGGCDEAAVEAVKKAKFTPGMQRGRPVKVSYTLPVTFRLSTSDKKPNS
jgi:protein TonB